MSSKVIHLTDENFSEYENSEKTLILDFYADWCGPCKAMAPIFERIAEEKTTENIVFAKVNTELAPEVSERFGIMSIPTLMILKEKTILNKKPGYHNEEALNNFLTPAFAN